MEAADITITQVSGDFQWDPKSYRWSCMQLGLHPDECVGMPFGSGKHTIAAALMESMQAALNLGYKAARISYLYGNHQIKSMDTMLAEGPVTINRARSAADKLMSM